MTSIPSTPSLPATSPATSSATSRVTLARRRLRLGITGVGSSVLLATALLVAILTQQLPLASTWRVLPDRDDSAVASAFASAAVLALLLFVAHALFLVAVEYAGGRRAIRRAPSLAAWTRAWLRGVLVLAVTLSLSVSVIAAAGVAGGTLTASGATVLLSLLLLMAQGPFARLVASLHLDDAPAAVTAAAHEAQLHDARIALVETSDEGFVGGWLGWDARTVWMPAWWAAPEHRDVLRVQLHRRAAQRASRARRRGWWRAALWPAIGVLVTTSVMPYEWTDARLWLALPALSTLWSFLAVLILPSVSRGAVFYADAAAARTLGAATTIAAIAELERVQDDEHERSPVVETIFHPVPAFANRRDRLLHDVAPPLGGGHQQTRLTLWASLGAGSLLGRVVHCNIGRPALWVVYPGD